MYDMSEKISEQIFKSEKLTVGLLLALVGGFLDTYSYLVRSNVFANAQTGNMVLFGVNIINKDYNKSLHYLIPILAYFIGIIIAEFIRIKFERKNNWRQLVILVELIVLIVVAFIPNGDYNYIANILISFICALQVQTFTKVHGLAFASTMCTGNLIKSANAFTNFVETKNKQSLINFKKYLLIISVFILGSIIGCLLTNIFGVRSILICPIILFAVIKIIHIK